MRIWTKDNKRRWIIPVIAFWLLLASLLSSACFLAGCGRGSGLNSSSGQEQEGFFEEGEESAQSENTADTPAEVYVHVCGCVKKPGLYILAAGSRVGDAVEMAGGMTKEADNAGVNLAALLEDGQQIYVPDQSEGRDRPDRGASDSGKAGQESPGETGSSETGDKVNINTADAADLMKLSGIGQSKAESILAYRQEHGRFSSVEEIKNVTGIGEGIYNRIKDSITV